MSDSQALINDVESPQMERAKTGWSRQEKLLLLGVLLLTANLAAVSVMAVQVLRAQGALAQTENLVATAQEIMGIPDRLLHGNLARAVNSLVQTDFGSLSRNTTKLASAVQALFETATDSEMLSVNKYSSLVNSVAKRVGTLNPRFPPAPKPTDDQGVVNMFSYLTEWISTQADKNEFRTLAKSCTALLDQALTLDWSDTYVWGQGRYQSSWDANSWKNAGRRVQEYCQKIQNLDPSVFEEN